MPKISSSYFKTIDPDSRIITGRGRKKDEHMVTADTSLMEQSNHSAAPPLPTTLSLTSPYFKFMKHNATDHSQAFYTTLPQTPLGPLLLVATTKGICKLTSYDQPLNLTSTLGHILETWKSNGINNVVKCEESSDKTSALTDAEKHLQAASVFLAAFFKGFNPSPLSIPIDFSASIPPPTLKRRKLHQTKGEEKEFQLKVWEGLRKIPYGQTWSYAQLAEHIGHCGASRAVGTANAKNPVPLIVPCHRVIGADGKLRGFSFKGGLEAKQWLLTLERG
ncbi:hypothetical protein HDV05_001501 [Chytridiales sp. JEL 0842]|nr:hypothetical protein HDV05_001501 [Chytridiales sp. JEL 0842]